MVGSPRPRDADDREIFLAAVKGARPLSDRERSPPPRRTAGERPAAPAPPAPPALAIDRSGERVSGRAHGVNRRQVAALRAGRPAPEASLDLHGSTARQARDRLGRFLADAEAAELRCVRVITGKGRHSESGPVLREAVAGWLSGPLAASLRAFATSADGGSYLVLLRRS